MPRYISNDSKGHVSLLLRLCCALNKSAAPMIGERCTKVEEKRNKCTFPNFTSFSTSLLNDVTSFSVYICPTSPLLPLSFSHHLTTVSVRSVFQRELPPLLTRTADTMSLPPAKKEISENPSGNSVTNPTDPARQQAVSYLCLPYEDSGCTHEPVSLSARTSIGNLNSMASSKPSTRARLPATRLVYIYT
jgi:hypothetical protein